MMRKFGESVHPVFRATSPLSRGTLKSKGGGKLSIHFNTDGDTIETVFRAIISVNQLSIYGAVSDLRDEYSSCQTRTVRPVLTEQFDPFFASEDLLITTPTPSIEIPAQEDLLQKYNNKKASLRIIIALTNSPSGRADAECAVVCCRCPDDDAQFPITLFYETSTLIP